MPCYKDAFDCKFVSFCIQLNTLIWLGLTSSFIFVILPCSNFHVISQSNFLIWLGPTPYNMPKLFCIPFDSYISGSNRVWLKMNWNFTEMCLPFSRLNGDWMVTKMRLEYTYPVTIQPPFNHHLVTIQSTERWDFILWIWQHY